LLTGRFSCLIVLDLVYTSTISRSGKPPRICMCSLSTVSISSSSRVTTCPFFLIDIPDCEHHITRNVGFGMVTTLSLSVVTGEGECWIGVRFCSCGLGATGSTFGLTAGLVVLAALVALDAAFGFG